MNSRKSYPQPYTPSLTAGWFGFDATVLIKHLVTTDMAYLSS
jgi:hypothetical protein